MLLYAQHWTGLHGSGRHTHNRSDQSNAQLHGGTANEIRSDKEVSFPSDDRVKVFSSEHLERERERERERKQWNCLKMGTTVTKERYLIPVWSYSNFIHVHVHVCGNSTWMRYRNILYNSCAIQKVAGVPHIHVHGTMLCERRLNSEGSTCRSKLLGFHTLASTQIISIFPQNTKWQNTCTCISTQ